MGRKLNLLALAGAMLVSQPAVAAVATFTFSVDGSTNTVLGSAPYGTVTVTENAGKLDFVQTLTGGFRIHDGNANHNAFAFSINSNPAVIISNLTAGFVAVSPDAGTSVTAPPFGTFLTAIDCAAACGSGFSGGFAGPLTFTVQAAGGLSLASLGFNTVSGNNIYFASDLIISNGNTGNVGALRNPGAVPEPATWAMMLVGFGAMGVSMRRRRSLVQQTA